MSDRLPDGDAESKEADAPGPSSRSGRSVSPCNSRGEEVWKPAGGGMEASLAKFKTGAGSFQSVIAELVAAVDVERKQLEESRRRLEEERQAWEQERKRVQAVLSDSEQVTLNVGGYRFTTTVHTLRNAPAPSLFAAMFSGRHTVTKDASGCYFIDRDGRHFHDILNYLRDGQFNYPVPGASDSHALPGHPPGVGVGHGHGHAGALPLPLAAPLPGVPSAADHKYLLELRAEANYYGLTGLMAAIDRYPHGLVRLARAAALNLEDSWMYEDGQDEIVFSLDRPLQLLGVGLCGTEGGLTVELELYEVDPEDFSRELATLSSCAQSFTKADGHVLRMMLPDPVLLQPGKYFMLSALIKGAESYCCEECLETVIVGGTAVHFHPWESPNGTNENRGQFPELYVRLCDK